MKKISLALITLIIIGICIPVVSAEEYNFVLDDSSYNQQTSTSTGDSALYNDPRDMSYLWILNANELYGNELVTVYSQSDWEAVSNYNDLPQSAVTRVTIGDFIIADFGYFKYKVGQTDYFQCYLANIEYINDYPTGLTGRQKFLMVKDDPDFVFPQTSVRHYSDLTGDYNLKFGFGTNDNIPFDRDFTYYSIFKNKWMQNLMINTGDYDSIELLRNGLTSIIYIDTPNIDYTNNPIDNSDYLVYLDSLNDRPYLVSVKNPITNKYFNYTVNLDGLIGETEPGETYNDSVTVYVRNSQTGALIADSHIDISANVNGEFHEVVNETLPGGIYTINLQPTGGGLPNPDYYRLNATAEGYNSIMPYIDFEVDGATTIYAYMEPTGGAPEDVNKTFIDFYVRDLDANPISGATVKFGDYTLLTNSAGYTIFEVYKNQTYTWTVSKSGYGSVTGNAVIGSNARYTINAVIAPAVTSTTPTPIPTSTSITPTPTLTAPTGEPVSNLLEWFAAHFGMILGGGVEVGKIFMWLCFTVPVGVFVGKEAKAGAAGFMAGAGIVTLFFVLIGWVPIWLVVLLALIIGLLYAKVFHNTDNGGGR